MAFAAGVFLFCANLLIQVSDQIANENNHDLSVVTTMSNWVVPMCLLGSFLIYKDNLTRFQIAGSLICFAGILTMSLSKVFSDKRQIDTLELLESANKALKIMLINSFISMLLLSTRMNMTKYCTRILSCHTFLKYNFLADFICALIVILLSAVSAIQVPMGSYLDIETIRTGLSAGLCGVIAELFVVKALNDGPTGPVSAIISFNSVLGSILICIFTGISLTVLQIIGIVIAFLGIITIAVPR